MSEKLIFQNKLTKEEINENKYWIDYILNNFSELKLTFEKTKYSVIPIPIKIIKDFPKLAEFISYSRTYLLNSYFISKKSPLLWENIQGLMKQKNMKAYLWTNSHSILRGNNIMGMISQLYLFKQKAKEILKEDSNYTDNNLKSKIIEILENIQIPIKDYELIDNNLDERIKFVNELLEEHYKVLVELTNLSK